MSAAKFQLFKYLYRRELFSNYLGSLSGFLWVFISPLALLAIYSFVFIEIFKARIPEADHIGFVPYLALGFWPWIAFADSLSKSTTIIQSNAALVKKVALPHEVLVFSCVAATYSMHMLGYALVILVLSLVGVELNYAGLPLLLLLLLQSFIFAIGMAFFFSATQVFIKDLALALGPIMTLWFFSTPILYSSSLIPEAWRHYSYFNPMAYFVITIRENLLFDTWQFSWLFVLAWLGTIVIFLLGRWFFNRCSPRFEDFI